MKNNLIFINPKPDFIPNWYVAQSLGFPSCLPEMFLRTFTIALILTATLLFEELDQRLDAIAADSGSSIGVSQKLDQWKGHHDLLCRLVEQINGSVGIVLSIFLVHGFCVMPELLYTAYLLFPSLIYLTSWLPCVYNVLYYFYRLAVVLIICHRLNRQVGLYIVSLKN